MPTSTRRSSASIAGLEKKNRVLNPTGAPRRRAPRARPRAWWRWRCRARDPVHKVSIIPRGVGALGYTIQRPTEDRFLMTRGELENKMAVLLGGRAAEEVVFGHLSTGAADDLAKVTDIARSMVMRYGMVKNLGHVAYENEPRRSSADRHPARTANTARKPRARSTSRCATSSRPATRRRSASFRGRKRCSSAGR